MLPQFRVVALQSNQCPTIPCVDTTTQLQLQTFNVRLLSVNTNYFLRIFNLSEYSRIFCATKIWRYTVFIVVAMNSRDRYEIIGLYTL